MIPHKQEFRHDPEAGVYGDCFRATLASILELPLAEVPHFLADGANERGIMSKRANAWLRPHGLALLTIGAFDMGEWLAIEGIDEIFHEIGDKSPRFDGVYHSVVGRNGVEIHDCHPDAEGLMPVTDERTFTFIVSLGPLATALKRATPSTDASAGEGSGS